MRVTPPRETTIGVSRTTTKVIKVRSNKNILVYGINKKQYSTDGFLALPDSVLGRWNHFTPIIHNQLQLALLLRTNKPA